MRCRYVYFFNLLKTSTVGSKYTKSNVYLFKLWGLQSTLNISKLWGLFFTSANYPKCKLICTCKKVSNAKLWLEKAIIFLFWFRYTLRVSQNSRYPSSRYRDSTVSLKPTYFIQLSVTVSNETTKQLILMPHQQLILIGNQFLAHSLPNKS